MKSRLPIITLALTVMMLSGCSGQPAPEATTPAFTSDAQAFAAAEQTYRNYVDALNQVDLSDPKTFEAVYAWTTGDANAAARKTFTQMHADGWQISGQSVIALMARSSSSSTAEPQLAVCLDVSRITGFDATGKSVVSLDRRPIQSMKLTFQLSAQSPTGLLLSVINGREGAPLCAGN